MTPQAKPTTIPGKVVDALVGAVGSPLVSGLNTVASYHPNLNSAGEMFEKAIGSSSSSTPLANPLTPAQKKAAQDKSLQNQLNLAKDMHDTSALEKLSSSNPNLSRGDFDRTARAKGGVVSYKSISDMERGR